MNNSYIKIKHILKKHNYFITHEIILNYGIQIRLLDGQIINVYNKGTFCFQGKTDIELCKIIEEEFNSDRD